jgi:hypothetical protein
MNSAGAAAELRGICEDAAGCAGLMSWLADYADAHCCVISQAAPLFVHVSCPTVLDAAVRECSYVSPHSSPYYPRYSIPLLYRLHASVN